MNFGDLFHVSSLLALNSFLPLTVLSHIKDSGDCNTDRGKYCVYTDTHGALNNKCVHACMIPYAILHCML